MKQENNQDFDFKEIITLKPSSINTIVLLVVATFFGLYYFLIGLNFKLSFVMITFGLIVLGITLILKAASAEIHMSFTGNSLIVKRRNEKKVYKTNDITGLYSINYNVSKSSRIAFEILYSDGTSLHLYDIEFNDKKDDLKNRKLKKFLNTFLEETGLNECKKIKSLNLHKMGQYFYYKLNEI